jgi:hypothetical protein
MQEHKPETEPQPAEKFLRLAKELFAVPKAELAEVMSRKDAPQAKRGRKPVKKTSEG